MIIHLCGMPGVGKLTIANHLKETLSARLIDNHLFVDLATSICDRDEDYIPFLAEITAASFSKLAERMKDSCIIFTNSLLDESPEGRTRLKRIIELAALMGFPFIPILIICNPEENQRRLTAPDRERKGKLRDALILDDILKAFTPAHLPNHPNELTLDTSDLTAAAASQRIADHCRRLPISSTAELSQSLLPPKHGP